MNHQITVFYTHFERPLPDWKWTYYMDKLPQETVKAINKYMRWQDRHASLFGKLLLREGLQHYGRLPGLADSLQFTKYNRPYLHDEIDFNISHSGAYVVCAFSESGIVGIDVERINQDIDISHFTSVLTPAEYKHLLSSDNQARDFFDYWCKKESVIKADGRGFSAPVLNILLKPSGADFEGKAYHLKELQLSDEYKIYVAREGSIEDIKAIPFDF